MSSGFEWKINPMNEQFTSPVIDYIIECGRDLEKQTEGKVIGILAKAKHPLADALMKFAELGSGIYPAKLNSKAKDATLLYEKGEYQFIICDKAHSYELCVFTMSCNNLMPISVIIDSTIASEAKVDEKIEIHSFKSFKDLFSRIVTSNKVVYIISCLMNLPDVPEISASSDDEVEQDEQEPEEES